MKRTLFIAILSLLTGAIAFARPVSEQEAFRKAQQFMDGKLFVQTVQPRKIGAKALTPQSKNYYVFNAEKEAGFVIVAGDDRFPAILGYSEHGTLDISDAPCNLRWLLDSYDQAIANVGQGGAAPIMKAEGIDRTAVAPLVATTWGQGAPYNNLCPVVDGNRCVTGCVATAMAQVVNFNRWPVGETAGVEAYETGSYQIAMPELPPTQFDWDNLTDTDKARLMLYCGQSVYMDYGPEESGAWTGYIAYKLPAVFGYSGSAKIEERANYGTAEEWDNLIYNELSNHRPVVYSGSGTGGHAFVVCGYQNQKFYVNWGWDGYADGYFDLSVLNPEGMNFSNNQYAIVGIEPPAGLDDTTRPKATVHKITIANRAQTRATGSDNFTGVTLSATVASNMFADGDVQLGFALYEKSGELLQVLGSATRTLTVGAETSYDVDIEYGAATTPGTYIIRAINRVGDDDPWLLDNSSSDVYVVVTIDETTSILHAMPWDTNYSEVLGIFTLNGITYKLEYNYGSYQAWVQPYLETEKYAGDIYIPDMAYFGSFPFTVEGEYNGVFADCPELTSLSVNYGNGYFYGVRNCKKLQTLEIREGIKDVSDILNCPLLESITYPATVTACVPPYNCSKLKTITFASKDKVTFYRFMGFWWNTSYMPSLTDVYFMCELPPAINTFYYDMEVNENATIHIPQNALEAYQQSEWKDWLLATDQPAVAHYPRRVVMEEATGTWCGYCPYGIVAIEMAKQNYPDNFIAISMHDDEMFSESYGEVLNGIAGGYYPSSRLNRSINIWPHPYYIDNVCRQLVEGKATAKIEATAQYSAADANKVVVSTECTFGYLPDETAEYRIAYVVLEDRVGPYQQINYLYDDAAEDNPDDVMNEWLHNGETVEMLFDDVARALYGGWLGVEGTVPTQLEALTPYSYDYTLDLPDNIQNKANISIVTMLINTGTGEIVNAARTSVSPAIVPGDIDGDGNIDIADVVVTVNHILGVVAYDDATVASMDLNSDGEVNVGDIIVLIKLVLSADINASGRMNSPLMASTIDDITRYTAFQFCVTVPDGTTLQAVRLAGANRQTHRLSYQPLGNNTYRVAVYSMGNSTLSAVNGELIEMELSGNASGAIATSNVMFVMPDGERLWLNSLPSGAVVTAISELAAEEAPSAVNAYNMQGAKIDASNGLKKGIYVINGKKVIIK